MSMNPQRARARRSTRPGLSALWAVILAAGALLDACGAGQVGGREAAWRMSEPAAGSAWVLSPSKEPAWSWSLNPGSGGTPAIAGCAASPCAEERPAIAASRGHSNAGANPTVVGELPAVVVVARRAG